MSSLRLPRALRSKGSFARVVLPLVGLYVLWRLIGNWSEVHSTAVPIYRYENTSLPPIYPALRDRERRLPQHSASLPFPEGKGGRYLRFGNQLWGVGLNNQLQETFLNTYIAHEANRAYVFTPFTWNLNENDFVEIEADSHLSSSGYKVRPARVPLTAYLNAPTTGTPWPPGDRTPRSVSLEWWDHICPEKERLNLNTTAVNEELGIHMSTDEGNVIVTKWAAYLKKLDHSCVNLLWGTPRIIDYDLVGSDRLESIWADYSKSPVLTQFDWSVVVHAGLNRNLHLLAPPNSSRIRGTKFKESPFIPGLVSMHVRRGDYEGHCKWMAPFGEFNGWNKLSFLPDRWHPPWSTPTEPGEARARYAYERCWIDIPAIVSRLERTRSEHASSGTDLDTVFISTNGEKEWIKSVREALKGPPGIGWNVVTSKDLALDWQQQGVDMAIDMEIAARGEVFIGNGFSSMSSTVTRVRLVRGIAAANTRFW